MITNKLNSFQEYQNIYLIGIGGIGLSALARLLNNQGKKVTGSDQSLSKNLQLLQQEGIKIHQTHSSKNITSKIDLVIHTTAIPQDNIEIQEAIKRKIPILTYPQAIGKLTKSYKTISICGTHGKTTTTALLGLMLNKSKSDPTVIVGSLIKEFNHQNQKEGKSDYLVLESCEYQDAFLNYSPQIIILNNIEAEHLDYFKNKKNYLKSFEKFINKLSSNGLLVANIDDKNIQKLLKTLKPKFKIIKFGENKKADYQIRKNKLILPNKKEILIQLQIPGQHNIYNAVAALIVANQLKIKPEHSLKKIKNFKGASRRFEIVGKIKNTTIVDDYGHTPTEIQATLKGARDYFGKEANILVVFQPHQYSRTHLFLKEFGNSFKLVNKVLIPNIYQTRDSQKDLKKVNTDILVKEINKNGKNKAINTHNFEKTLAYIKDNYTNYKAILSIGAGDITNLSQQIIKIK